MLRQLVENAMNEDWDGKVEVPATVEDRAVVDKAKGVVREYFEQGGPDGWKETKAKL